MCFECVYVRSLLWWLLENRLQSRVTLWFLSCMHIVLILFSTSIYLHCWGMQLELLKFQPKCHNFRKAFSDLHSAQLKSQWNGTEEKGLIEAQNFKLISWFFHAFSAKYDPEIELWGRNACMMHLKIKSHFTFIALYSLVTGALMFSQLSSFLSILLYSRGQAVTSSRTLLHV